MAKTVLIVDDTAFMRMTLKKHLTENGYEVVGEGADGLEAIANYKKHKPDLVTMDITMPNLDGIEATKKIIAMDQNAAIIMVSAMGQKTLVLEAIQAGAKDFVVKPYQPDRIAQALSNLGN